MNTDTAKNSHKINDTKLISFCDIFFFFYLFSLLFLFLVKNKSVLKSVGERDEKWKQIVF